MLSAAFPAALLGLAAMPLLWWWHRARQRPREITWGSLLLWKRLPPPSPEAIARQKRRSDLALAAALGAVGCFVVGAAGLSATVVAPEPSRVAVVVDATASARGSWEAIQKDADTFLSGLPGDATVDLAIVPGSTASGLTPAQAREKLAAAAATDAPGNPEAACAQFASDDLVAAFSDHAGPEGVAIWRIHPPPRDAGGVATLSVVDGRVLAAIRNAGEARFVAWTIRAGGATSTGTIQVGRASYALLDEPLPAAASEVELRLSADGFPANDARFWVASSSPPRLGLAGRDFPALRRALEGAGVRPELGGEVKVWVGEMPAAAPTAPAVLIDPTKGVPGLFDVTGTIDKPKVTVADANDPAIRAAAGADLADLQVERATKLTFVRPVRTLVEPLVYEVDRILVLAFDPASPNSNFTRLVAFPLLWADVARRFNPARQTVLPTGAVIASRNGPRTLLQSGIETIDGVRFAANFDDVGEAERAEAPSNPQRPSLDLPSKSVIRSRMTVPPAGGALLGLLLLVLSWLAARSRP